MLEQGKFVADRYEILAVVGAGGMSDVYKAKDHVLGRFVAIKVLKQEFAEDVNFVTKFRTEAQSAAGLEHPNIVNIYDVGSEEGFHYIVMEYVEGITLKTYIEKKRQLSYKEAISIAIQVGRGIEAAHNKNIVHRDIKPQNIMISTEGKVKVTDFGIARAATSNTIHSDVMGSVHYSSPEQARNGFVDGKSDIYSLGIVMYEMVTGRVPFDGDTTVAIAIQHLQEEMESPRSFVPDLPISLEKIILKCTQKSADRRYVSIGELLEDLRHALVSPDEDFVVFSPAFIQDKTRMISADEVNQIREETAGIHVREQEMAPKQRRPLRDEDDEDEEEGGVLNPKMEKAITIMGIVAAVIILLIVIYLAVSMFGSVKFPFGGKDNQTQEDVTFPDIEASDTDMQSDTDDKKKPEKEKKVKMISLLGKELDEARSELKEIGLELRRLGTKASDEYEEGLIAEQDIEEGKSVAEGTVIQVTVSSGPADFEMIKVTGNPAGTARDMLSAHGLEVNPESKYEFNELPEGTVIRQSPEAGARVKKGDVVTLTISKGIEQVQVPDLRKCTEAEAAQRLLDNNLERGNNIDSAYDDTIPEGCIISQTPQAGSSVNAHSKVDYVVSLGKEEILYRMKDFSVNEPANSESVISANISLLDANGTVVDEWSGIPISSFPYVISTKETITTSTGTIQIEWVLDDGDTQTQEQPVTFDQK
ncbi:MAG: Stk1 family PASTA domain-containing Ser/Thr kinase [Eubacterium sp.]|jgi:Serine/threonine protein kinase|nr:Stk1 family PASTA domain-containing Ser/Thr kinase [Eubacterium sp.]